MRVRVPKQGTGAERSVVVMNSRNGEGAKGSCRPILLFGQPGREWKHENTDPERRRGYTSNRVR